MLGEITRDHLGPLGTTLYLCSDDDDDDDDDDESVVL